jgi:hypothetical protein
MRVIILCAVMQITMLCTGCVEVKPWQKGNLARPHMAFEQDPLEARSLRHTYHSKEGSFGGYGVGGGGCGCN